MVLTTDGRVAKHLAFRLVELLLQAANAAGADAIPTTALMSGSPTGLTEGAARPELRWCWR